MSQGERLKEETMEGWKERVGASDWLEGGFLKSPACRMPDGDGCQHNLSASSAPRSGRRVSLGTSTASH